MKILGIESSCDETAASVVTESGDILSNVIYSQMEHQEYGGVVPEIAARAHVNVISPTIKQALEEAKCTLDDIDAIAATSGPGLIGGVIVGLMAAKGLALAADKPLYGINHLEGHALSPRLATEVTFPYLLLLVSGGHCQILVVEKLGVYHQLGTTIDDAIGEAFDKIAKMMGLGYPGGPVVEKRAAEGDETRFNFPTPLLDRKDCNFSLSGLKTAVLREVEKHKPLDDQTINDICASFQFTVGKIIENKLGRAIEQFTEQWPEGKHMVVAGGVAANQYIRGILHMMAEENHLEFTAPPLKLCTDNAAMIAWAAIERRKAGMEADDLSITPKARWPLAQPC